ncbi:unnamed protein product [Dovyalis caffra]|uniref:Uncharacterized protein n=1 Tax=Dovyalis caffra TaxID=77055 RepID=A0AAV1S6F0_9ROSI|nr:unnamed protein product [Dovyalis caffra]
MILIIFQIENIKEANITQHNTEEVCNALISAFSARPIENHLTTVEGFFEGGMSSCLLPVEPVACEASELKKKMLVFSVK